MGRPAIGMAVKNQLVEGLHGHIPGIIVIADDFAEDLRADPFEFLFVERRMLEHVGQKRKAEVCILLEHAGGGGGEILCRMGFQRASHKIDLFGDLSRCPGQGAFIEEAGGQIGQTCFVGWILRRSHLDQGVDFHGRKKMLFQKQHGHAVRGHGAGGDDVRSLRQGERKAERHTEQAR